VKFQRNTNAFSNLIKLLNLISSRHIVQLQHIIITSDFRGRIGRVPYGSYVITRRPPTQKFNVPTNYYFAFFTFHRIRVLCKWVSLPVNLSFFRLFISYRAHSQQTEFEVLTGCLFLLIFTIASYNALLSVLRRPCGVFARTIVFQTYK